MHYIACLQMKMCIDLEDFQLLFLFARDQPLTDFFIHNILRQSKLYKIDARPESK